MNVGIIGAGAIAGFLLKEINQNQYEGMHVTSVFIRNKEKYQLLEEKYGVTMYTDLRAFLDSGIDIVVEAATIDAVNTLLPTVLREKDAVVISVGAFADEQFFEEIVMQTQSCKRTIHLPSGAIGGIDVIQNVQALGMISSILLTTRKPAHTLLEETVENERVIFEGKAIDAIKQYPKNLNVSIILSLAGVGIKHTNVRLIADPHIEKNRHQIDVVGDFGEATFTIINNPHPDNPNTSYLAAMSILGTLKRLQQNIRIG